MDHRDLAWSFQSLGGSGRGAEFAAFQQQLGIEPNGLLAWADLGSELLIRALEARFDGVGLPENTIVFTPDHSDEWWTKDQRYWMAMRSFIKTSDASIDQATSAACDRVRSLRRAMIADLEAGRHMFVFRDMHRNLTAAEVERLHRAVRAYGDGTVFYVRYADEVHPAGSVVASQPGLLIGYLDHFTFSADNQRIGSADGAWLALCERACQLHERPGPQGFDGNDAAFAAHPGATAPMAHPGATAPMARPGATAPMARPDATAPMAHPIATAPIASPTATAPVDTPTAAAPATPVRLAQVRPARQIVLIGNCQMQAMAGLYKRFVAGRSGDVMQHVPSYQDLTNQHRDAIQRADIVVEQLFDLQPQAETGDLSTTTPRIFIPMVTAAFLWPFAGSPHPKNVGTPFLAGGPYGGEAADSYLNRLIVSGVDPDEAADTYTDLDVNSRVNLDRLFEIVMDRQRSRDEAADYRIADIMARHFRTEQIFLSPYHPNVRIATELASRFFQQLGAQPDEIERMRHCTRITPFPKSELPLHPSVCRHFGLDFIAPDRRYRFMNEGLFTFREYARRYMRYEWNEALEEGMHLAHTGQPDAARERLSQAVARSPRSAAGSGALSHVLNNLGQKDAAIAAARNAVEIEPDEASHHASLGSLLGQTGQFDAALDELRSAVAADPVEPHYRVLLAHLLRQCGDVGQACELMREAIRLDPYSATLLADLAGFLEAGADPAGAVAALQDAVAMAPANEAMHHRLAQLLGRLGRVDQAIAVARVAVALAPQETRPRVLLSDLLLQSGNPADALNEAYAAAVNQPDNAQTYGHLGHVLFRVEDFPAAEAAFRRAARLDPRDPHFRHELSIVLLRQQRFDAAIAAARDAAELDPRNPHRLAHLAGLFGQRGDLPAAQTTQRSAVELAPEVVALRVGLSDLLARDGRLDEALAEAGLAVQYHPNSVHALGHLAHVAQLRGEFARAEATLRRALEIDPREAGLLRRMASLQARAQPVVAA